MEKKAKAGEKDDFYAGMILIRPGESESVRGSILWDEWNLGQEKADGTAGFRPVVSLVGAGGKTSIITRLAWECRMKGRKAVVATTTHMMKPQNWTLLTDFDRRTLERLLEEECVIWAGKRSGPHPDKIQMPDESSWMHLISQSNAAILLEADGARHYPFKIPGEKEPVITEETTTVIAVLGLDALGKAWQKECFRWENADKILGQTTDVIRKEDFVSLLLSDSGLRKKAPLGADYKIVLNKADTRERIFEGFKIRKLLAERGFFEVYLTHFDSEFRKAWL